MNTCEGPTDNVRCFCCDGGLKHWQPNDDPWTEHRRWFSRCPYVVEHGEQLPTPTNAVSLSCLARHFFSVRLSDTFAPFVIIELIYRIKVLPNSCLSFWHFRLSAALECNRTLSQFQPLKEPEALCSTSICKLQQLEF